MHLLSSMTLRTKMIMGGVLFTLLPLALVGTISYWKTTQGLTQEASIRAEMLAAKLAQLVDTSLREELKTAQALASLPEVRKGLSKPGQAEATQAMKAAVDAAGKALGKDYELIFACDGQGQLVADSMDGKALSLKVADRDYFKTASQGQANVGQVVRSRASGKPVAVVAAPVKGNQDQFVGMVALVLNIDFLSSMVSGTRIGQTGYGWMVDSCGLVIAHPNPKNILELNLGSLDGMQEITRAALAGGSGMLPYVFNGVEKFCGFAPVKITGWSVGATQDSAEFLSASHSIRDWVLWVSLASLALVVVVVLLFVSTITGPLSRLAASLGEGADQVATAAEQIARASQSLAQGASEQAASLEEASATLEELAGTSGQTVEITQGANQRMNQNIAKTAKSLKALKELTAEMAHIEEDSTRIGSVTKNIDEIAFQTNLLALNASVEAARAGQAGQGFAVVADEVRALAMRAAQAANGTQELLEGMRERIVKGAESLRQMSGDFEGIVESATVMGEQTASITNASQEQAKAIAQISQGTSNLDVVTQQVAANSEESAASAEELAAQAETMRGMVGQMLTVIYGSGGERRRHRRPAGQPTDRKPKRAAKATPARSHPARALPAPDGEGQDF